MKKSRKLRDVTERPQTFNDALYWCVRYRVEIDPNGGEDGVQKLLYTIYEKGTGERVQVFKSDPDLVTCVNMMIDEIGLHPQDGVLNKLHIS